MIKAHEAREMVEKARELEIATRQNRAEEFCKGLEDTITNIANKRGCQCTVIDIPKEIYSYVVTICKDNGYTVTQLNNTTIQLIW